MTSVNKLLQDTVDRANVAWWWKLNGILSLCLLWFWLGTIAAPQPGITADRQTANILSEKILTRLETVRKDHESRKENEGAEET